MLVWIQFGKKYFRCGNMNALNEIALHPISTSVFFGRNQTAYVLF